MKINRMVWLGVAALLALGSNLSMGQEQNRDRGRDRGGPPDRGPSDRGPSDRGRGWDPAQMRERMLEFYKEQLEITDETEWKAISPLIQKVMEARVATYGGMRSMFGRGSEDRGRGPGGGQTMPELEALQRAVDGKASNSELKAAVAKYVEARKAKQADLEQAQADLRKVLSVRQEAVATLRGLL